MCIVSCDIEEWELEKAVKYDEKECCAKASTTRQKSCAATP